MWKEWFGIWLISLMAVSGLYGAAPNFGREILPLLSDRCLHCHGPDGEKRKGKLRLDDEADAKRRRDDHHVIAPTGAAASELWLRLLSNDPDEQMPPPDSHQKQLTSAERELIRRWLDEGAPWGRHWSLEPIGQPQPPVPADNPIDAFVAAELRRQRLTFSPPAPLHTQLRRLHFDLTGLPPTPTAMAAWLADPSPENWSRIVNGLLATPQYGERMAMWWLDAARYADTDGFQQDAERHNWPWRDWVIRAFNSNMPFDQFTQQQFAGDLLPEATPEQILATCFHRNHMTNGEGGRLAEESRIDYVLDRVNSVGTVWLGLTLGCTQCHSHKFDPISQKEYYSLFAFFNSIDETGEAGDKAKPYLKYQEKAAAEPLAQAEQHAAAMKARLAAERAAVQKGFDGWLAARRAALPADYQTWHIGHPADVHSTEGTTFSVETDGTVQTTGPTPANDDYRIEFVPPPGLSRITGWQLEVLPHPTHHDGGLTRAAAETFILTNVKVLVHDDNSSQVRELPIATASAAEPPKKELDGKRYGNIKSTLDDDPRNGWATAGTVQSEAKTAIFALQEPLLPSAGMRISIVLKQRATIGDTCIGRFRLSFTHEQGDALLKFAPSAWRELAAMGPEAPVSDALRKRLLDLCLLDDAAYQDALRLLQTADRQVAEFRAALAPQQVMVLQERQEPRKTHILERGGWDAKGDEVQPDIIQAVLPRAAGNVNTRLDLARWLTAADNPLTPRVTVNHLWQLVFGAGLVRTPEDFGLQGEQPTHPELLDYLAAELVSSGWDVRHILRLMVTSRTYRQGSDATAELLERDPDNRLLARASRFRLPAWMIRDNALQVSGLLNPTIGGPPVRPWQPDGVWRDMFMGRLTYDPSVGPARYRRTLYAFWRRSSAPAFLFDNAQRRSCDVGVHRTNTPLQALTLLNDQTMLEAARVLADRAIDPSQAADLPTRLQEMAGSILARPLTNPELDLLLRSHQQSLSDFALVPAAAGRLATIGQQPPPIPEQAPAVAAWMTTATTILNLDEAITHE